MNMKYLYSNSIITTSYKIVLPMEELIKVNAIDNVAFASILTVECIDAFTSTNSILFNLLVAHNSTFQPCISGKYKVQNMIREEKKKKYHIE